MGLMRDPCSLLTSPAGPLSVSRPLRVPTSLVRTYTRAYSNKNVLMKASAPNRGRGATGGGTGCRSHDDHWPRTRPPAFPPLVPSLPFVHRPPTPSTTTHRPRAAPITPTPYDDVIPPPNDPRGSDGSNLSFENILILLFTALVAVSVVKFLFTMTVVVLSIVAAAWNYSFVAVMLVFFIGLFTVQS